MPTYETSSPIPVIDLSLDARSVEGQIGSACAEWGIFRVVEHGISTELLDSCLDQARQFFALPPTVKQAISRTRDNPWGYYDRELTKNVRDKKEIFDFGPDHARGFEDDDPFAGLTPWPEGWTAFRERMRSYLEACEGLSRSLLRSIALGLGDKAGSSLSHFLPAPTSFLRLNHYPVTESLGKLDVEREGFGVHQHTDAGALTVLLEDGRPGLQVLRQGAWIDAGYVAGALTINIGDMVQVLSNDCYAAPIHRVMGMVDVDRYSIPFFFNPTYAAVVSPLPTATAPHKAAAYSPIRWSEFRRARADGDFGDFGREVQISDFRRMPPVEQLSSG
jgi:isopenicillin N synthase-like dioxygenase